MKSFGQITLQLSKKPHECKQCNQFIESGQLNIRVIGMRGKSRFATRYHKDCWLDLFNQGVDELLTIHQKIQNHEKGIRQSAVSKLSPEQRKRRKTIQNYLTTRDLPSLVEAYERHSTRRVLIVMNKIADRWEELHSMGVPFRESLLRPTEQRNETEQRLAAYIINNDSEWLNHLYPVDATYDQIISALRRPRDRYLPQWPIDSIEEVEVESM